MKFSEIIKTPEFTLTMSLQEAIDLWKIVNHAEKNGTKSAKKFVDVLHDFAANSNSYTEFI